MAKNSRKSEQRKSPLPSIEPASAKNGRNFIVTGRFRARGTRNARFSPPQGRKHENTATRHGGARPDFPRNFPSLSRGVERGGESRPARKGGKNAAGERSKRFFLLTYVLAQSKYHKRTKLGGKTTRPLLSVHYPSVMGPFYTMAVPRYALTIDQFLREDNAAHGNEARPGRSAPRRGAEAADSPFAHRRTAEAGIGERTVQERRASITVLAKTVTAFPRARLRR